MGESGQSMAKVLMKMIKVISIKVEKNFESWELNHLKMFLQNDCPSVEQIIFEGENLKIMKKLIE